MTTFWCWVWSFSCCISSFFLSLFNRFPCKRYSDSCFCNCPSCCTPPKIHQRGLGYGLSITGQVSIGTAWFLIGMMLGDGWNAGGMHVHPILCLHFAKSLLCIDCRYTDEWFNQPLDASSYVGMCMILVLYSHMMLSFFFLCSLHDLKLIYDMIKISFSHSLGFLHCTRTILLTKSI